MKQTSIQEYFFMCTESYKYVLWMEDGHTNKKFIVLKSDINRYKCIIMHTKIACAHGDTHYRISCEVLHYINTKDSI